MFDYETLRFIWWLLIGVILVVFMISDGFDMGIGCLLPLVARNDDERRIVINSVGAHWEGNQVWLILAGGALFAAWPRVYAAAFSGFYVAMILVLCSLFFRPLAFDDAPRDKCTLSCAINGIHAAFHYLKKNYISGCVMTVPTG